MKEKKTAKRKFGRRGYWIGEWKYLPYEGKKNKARKVVNGGLYDVYGRIGLCYNGLHAAPSLKEANRHRGMSLGGIISYVEVFGKNREDYCPGKRKFCGRYRKVLSMIPVDGEMILKLYPSSNDKLFRGLERRLRKMALESPAKTVKMPMTPSIALYRDRANYISLTKDERLKLRSEAKKLKK